MTIPDTIATSRLNLKLPQIGDAKALAKLANNIKVSRNLGTMPHPYRLEDAVNWISHQKQVHGRNGFNYGIFGKSNSDFMGIISIFNLMDNEPEYGFWLGEKYWGNGYISEAALALRDIVFEQLNAPFLLSKHMLDNPASGRVAEKCGLKEVERSALWSRALGAFLPGRILKLERIDWERLKGL